MWAMSFGVKIMIEALCISLISQSVDFGDFIRNLDFSFSAIGSKIWSIFEYYIFVHGWKAIVVIVIIMYISLMSFSVTRGFASLALNTLFSQPFNIARDVINVGFSAVGGAFKFIISAIRESRNDN